MGQGTSCRGALKRNMLQSCFFRVFIGAGPFCSATDGSTIDGSSVLSHDMSVRLTDAVSVELQQSTDLIAQEAAASGAQQVVDHLRDCRFVTELLLRELLPALTDEQISEDELQRLMDRVGLQCLVGLPSDHRIIATNRAKELVDQGDLDAAPPLELCAMHQGNLGATCVH